MAANWSDSEVDAIVRDYLSMLELEQTGMPYNKAEHRRGLMEVIGRSNGSIERKHMNVSAVMAALGLPHIDGYKPLGHYQAALFEAVEAHLAKRRDLRELLSGEAGQLPLGHIETADAIVFDTGPPPRRTREGALPEDIRRIIRRFEPPAERDARNRKLAVAGESVVFEMERRRLDGIGRPDLAGHVRWVARDDGDGYGYDILSFDGAGDEPERERWLEVKTTNGSRTTPFFITGNELRVSEDRPDAFRVVRLYDFRRRVRAYRLTPPLESQVWLSPMSYRASF